MQADLNFVYQYFHETVQRFWTLSGKLSVDDDLDLWKGRNQKRYDPKKAVRTGISSWKLVDACGYIWAMLFETDTKVPNNEAPSFHYLQILEETVPKGAYLFTIDAGLLGSFSNALYLSSKKRTFIISTAINKFNKLWSWLKKNLKLQEWRMLWHTYMGALCIRVKAKKFVNFLWNYSGIVLECTFDET